MPPLSPKSKSNQLECIVTYLEMRSAPSHPNILPSGRKVALVRAERPTISFYRYLYNTIGEDWFWWERRALSDAQLATEIHDSNVEIFILYIDGVPAGYAELDLRIKAEVELAYFGLIPEFIGRGLGRYLLGWAIDEAWQRKPERVWLHTCNFDHPKAIATYQKAGFVPYKQDTTTIEDPRASGLIPKHIVLPRSSRPE